VTSGNALFLPMDRVIQIAKSEDSIAVFFTDPEGAVQRRGISEFEILGVGVVVQ
jgi:hypothetical protein